MADLPKFCLQGYRVDRQLYNVSIDTMFGGDVITYKVYQDTLYRINFNVF